MNKTAIISTIVATLAVAGGGFLFWKSKQEQATGNEGTTGDNSTFVKLLRSAMEGLGTDEQLILDSLRGLESRKQWRDVQDMYYEQYGESLLEHIRTELSSSEFQEVVEALDALP